MHAWRKEAGWPVLGEFSPIVQFFCFRQLFDDYRSSPKISVALFHAKSYV
jgi:hypothetical protein